MRLSPGLSGVACVAAVAVLTLVVVAPAQAAPPYRVIGAVEVSASPNMVVVSPDGTQAYVPMTGDRGRSGGTSVIDLQSLEVVGVAPHPTGTYGYAAAFTPDGATALIASPIERALWVADAAAGAMNPVAAAVAGDSYDILIDPTGTTAYFPFYSGGLVQYDIATGVFGATVDFPRFVFDAELTADGAWIEAVDVGNSALVRTPASDPSAWTSTAVGSSAWALALSPDGALAYVTDSDLDVLHVVETATGTVLDSIPVGAVPLGVVVSPDGTRGYVAAFGDRAVSVVDLVAGATIATIPLAQAAEEVAVSPDGATVYAVGYNSRMLTAIDVAGVRPTTGAVLPDHGPVAGGTTIELTGSDFDGTTAVTFGGVAGTDLSIAPDGRSLTVVTPSAAAAGVVDIVVEHVAGDVLAGSFRYDAADGGGIRLADTGAELLPFGLVGVALLGVGVVLISRRRLLRG